MNQTRESSFMLGGLAFFAGVLATIFTAYAVVSKRRKSQSAFLDHYDGWEKSLGI